jgi:hypothetical protein
MPDSPGSRRQHNPDIIYETEHLGTDAEAIQYACAVARTDSLAVLHLLVTPRQRQACFGPTAFQARGALAPTGNRHDAALPSR